MKNAGMKKNIYCLHDLERVCRSANHRYLQFISAIEDRHVGRKKLDKISHTVRDNSRNYKGFNFFDTSDLKLFITVARGEFNLRGFSNKDIRQYIDKNSGQVSRLLKRLRNHGMIKKVGKSYRYYLTELGKQVTMTGLKLKELFILPELNFSRN